MYFYVLEVYSVDEYDLSCAYRTHEEHLTTHWALPILGKITFPELLWKRKYSNTHLILCGRFYYCLANILPLLLLWEKYADDTGHGHMTALMKHGPTRQHAFPLATHTPARHKETLSPGQYTLSRPGASSTKTFGAVLRLTCYLEKVNVADCRLGQLVPKHLCAFVRNKCFRL